MTIRLVEGVKYNFQKTNKFRTSYGYAGSKGYHVYRVSDNYSMGRYDSVKQFRDERKYVAKMKKLRGKL